MTTLIKELVFLPDVSSGEKIDYTSYFMNMAILASSRSTCLRRRVGAVAVKDRHILATGYNGVPKGIRHCDERGCIRAQLSVPSGQRHELCHGLHAEQNVVIQAAYHGISLKGCTIYCTTQPCFICAKILVNCGISEIICMEEYDDAASLYLLEEAKVPLIYVDSAVTLKAGQTQD